MKSNEILNQLASISGTNDKIEFLANNATDNLKTILHHTYSPKWIYGLKKVEHVGNESDNLGESIDDEIERFSTILKMLHTRDVTGNAAKMVVKNLIADLDWNSQELVIKVLNGDLRIGMNTSTINKAITDLIEREPPYQRCSLLKDSNVDDLGDWFYSQVKADGMFLNIIFKDGKVSALTRNGNEFPLKSFKCFNNIDECIIAGDNIVLTGEIVLFKNGVMLDRKKSNGLCNTLLKGGTIDDDYEPVLYIWDSIPLDRFVHKGVYEVPYEERLKYVENCVFMLNPTPPLGERFDNFRVIETKKVNSWEEAMQHYKDCRELGLEGTIIKNPESFWKDGTSKDAIKMKAEVQIDLRAIALTSGNGKNESTFGAVTFQSECGKLVVNVSGYTDDERLEIFENWESKYKNSIATITANELISKKKSDIMSLFLPRFDEWRFDKSVADDLERIKQIFESVIV